MNLQDYIALSAKQQASDLHLSAGHSPMVRIDGQLCRLAQPLLCAENLAKQLLATLSAEQCSILNQTGQIDYALENAPYGRCRGNIFWQHQGISAVFRHIPQSIPQLSELAAPTILAEQTYCASGLILVTGATGSGKSTTLAALINELNHSEAKHILTLEDPIEFIYQSEVCLIQQRQVTLHVESFAGGLRGALREDPDVILLGELRDPDTIRLALTAAETGHLVMSSLHTRSAIQAVERIIDVFPAEEKAFVRAQLAASLRCIVAQCLLPKIGGGRIAAYEVVINTPAVANLIREGKTHQLMSVVQTGSAVGMQTLAQSVQQRVAAGYYQPP